ncbi:MAG: carboxypeptidase-like regulatory domain-containing protein [Planctomycetota bacterium]
MILVLGRWHLDPLPQGADESTSTGLDQPAAQTTTEGPAPESTLSGEDSTPFTRSQVESVGQTPVVDSEAELPETEPVVGPIEWIEGRVIFPEGYEPHGPVQVYCLREAISRGGLDRVVLARQGIRLGDLGASSEATRVDLELKSEGRPLAVIEADEEGRFRLPAPAWRPGMHLQVLADNLYLAGAMPLGRGPWDHEVLLIPQLGASLTGSVVGPITTPEGEPDATGETWVAISNEPKAEAALVPGATNQSSGGVFVTRVRPDGTFAFQGLPPQQDVKLDCWSETLPYTQKPVGNLAAGDRTSVTIQLVPGRGVAGLVVDAEGRPLAGARVYAHNTGWVAATRRELRKAETDAQGRFQLQGLPTTALAFKAFADGYLSSESKEVPAGEDAREVRIELRAGASIHGRLVYDDGSPAAGFELLAQPDPANLAGMDGLTFMHHTSSRGQTTSDDDGHFELRGMAPIPYRVQASGTRDGDTYVAGRSGMRPGSEAVELVLGRQTALTGRVLDADGNPVPSYTLLYRRAMQGPFVTIYDGKELLRVQDQPEGRFQLPALPPGEWSLEVDSSAGLLHPALVVTLPRAADAEELVLTLTAPCRVQGLVLGPDGQPFPGARINRHSEGLQIRERLSENEFTAQATTDEEGKFELSPLAAEALGLYASAPDYCRSETATVTPAQGAQAPKIVLQLRQGGTLTGEILNEDGSTGSGRLVVVSNAKDPGNNLTATSDGKGEFRFEHVVPGSYQVNAMGKAAGMMETLGSENVDISTLIQGMETGTARGGRRRRPRRARHASGAPDPRQRAGHLGRRTRLRWIRLVQRQRPPAARQPRDREHQGGPLRSDPRRRGRVPRNRAARGPQHDGAEHRGTAPRGAGYRRMAARHRAARRAHLRPGDRARWARRRGLPRVGHGPGRQRQQHHARRLVRRRQHRWRWPLRLPRVAGRH